MSALNLPPGLSPAMSRDQVCGVLGVSRSTLSQRCREGKAPAPAWRGGRGHMWRGVDIARYLGLIPPEPDFSARSAQEDPFVEGARKLGDY